MALVSGHPDSLLVATARLPARPLCVWLAYSDQMR